MLNGLFIRDRRSPRYRQRDPEERRRGATRSDPETDGGLWQAVLTQIWQQMPWRHIAAVVMVGLAAGSLPWVSSQVLEAMDRDITGIAVNGDFNGISRERLEESLQPWLGRSFFATDLVEIKQAVEEEPWVDTAAVRREWPGRLVVEVVEQQPVAFWNGDSLITGTGEVFMPDSVAAAGVLPQLSGPADRATEVLEMARLLSQQLGGDELRLFRLQLEARGAWTLQLDNGITVELGRDQVEERLGRFLTVYRSHLSSRVAEVDSVDARYSNGVAVRWKQDTHENT